MTPKRWLTRNKAGWVVAVAATLVTAASPSWAAGPGSEPIGGAALARPGVVVDLPVGVPVPPAMPVASFLLADMDSGEVLAAKSAHARRLPASTLKVLTALTLIPTLNPAARVVATDADVRADGTKVGLLPGTAYPVRTLFQGLLMSSGNDAAYALARAGGGMPRTLAAMNAQAQRLGAFDTVAKDPSGLDQPGQSSSAYDLALIGREAMKLPALRGYVTTRQVPFPGGKRGDGKVMPGFYVGNHNKLLYNYPGTIGIKNGYTVRAGQTFVGAARRGTKTYLVTLMGGTTGGWRPTAALLDWAFAHGPSARPVGTLVEPGSVSRPSPSASATPSATPSATFAAPGTAATTAPGPTSGAFASPMPDYATPDALAGGAAPTAASGLPARLPSTSDEPRRPAFLRVSFDPGTTPWVIAVGAGLTALLSVSVVASPLRRRRQRYRDLTASNDI